MPGKADDPPGLDPMKIVGITTLDVVRANKSPGSEVFPDVLSLTQCHRPSDGGDVTHQSDGLLLGLYGFIMIYHVNHESIGLVGFS